MNVLATKREVHKNSNIPEWVFPAERMLDVMCQSDFLVIAVPITGETRQMIGREEIAHMKAGSYLLNVARGEVVDEEALMEALENGSIAGAALDVFANEPLGTDSRLWDAPNLIVSAHSGGLFADYDEAVVDLFIANVNSFTTSGNLSNEVNRSVGY
ncbi:D-2-hydroxyacid dehydrogenase, partial [Dehalococcoidia bacterium]|nr:D-2-hydroxyacid dehydrogenase [Dehalococcoidia bacterium]